MNSEFKILTLNIGNPSIQRAELQVNWIEKRNEDVFVLTETKNSKGCNYIADYFKNYNHTLLTMNSDVSYDVFFPKSSTGDLGVMIISKLPIKNKYSIHEENSIFFSRFVGCDIEIESSEFRVIGMYVPSRDRSEEKITRKKTFCIDSANHIKKLNNQSCIICGDLNVLERNHVPHYSTFFDWEYSFYEFFEKNNLMDSFRYCYTDKNEYSWVGRTNDGYRYDYIFVSNKIKEQIKSCNYIHETRHNKLTDHSAIYANILL